MIKVVVVDDHAVVREGLKRIVSESGGMVVSGEAADGQEAMRVIKSEPCDVVLLDISMPNKSGLDVLKELHAESPRLPVLVGHRDVQQNHIAGLALDNAHGFLAVG